MAALRNGLFDGFGFPAEFAFGLAVVQRRHQLGHPHSGIGEREPCGVGPNVWPALRYDGARPRSDFLPMCSVSTEALVVGGPNGKVVHAELR